MSREELDRLNAEGKAWRNRNKLYPTSTDVVDGDTSSPDVGETAEERHVGELAPIPNIQMDLFSPTLE